MADLKISQLTAGSPALTGDVIPIDRAGANFSLTVQNIATFAWNSPTLVTPALGTPASGNLVNCTGVTVAVGSITGLGTSVATALAVNVGTAGSPVVNGGALGAPSSGVLTSATGLPISTGLTGAGTGVLTALGVNVGSAGAFVVLGGALGTPSSGTLTSCTGLPIAGTTGYGTGVATALAVNIGSAGAFVTFNGALGTPSSGTLTNCTLPVGGISGLAAGIATWLGTPSSANLIAALTDETGTGACVFANTPTLVTPVLGVATATSINKVAFTAPATSATLTITDGKTATFSNSITFAGTDATTMTFPGASASVGYLIIPQNSQSAAYTTVLADSAKHIYHPVGDANARTFTIDSNASVPYPVGTAITFVNRSASAVTIAITSDTLTWSPTGATGSRTLAQYGEATALKIMTTEWLLSGTGLT